MIRGKQQLSPAECLALLQTEKRGVLSVLGDGGYPYGLPINHYYCPEDGRIYFHSGKVGHKLDAIARCDKASFCLWDQGTQAPGDWALYFRSVIVFGRIVWVEDPRTVCEMARRLSRKFTEDETYIQEEIDRFGANTRMFALVPEHISGKLVHEK